MANSFLLLETGVDYFLLEDGTSKLILEFAAITSIYCDVANLVTIPGDVATVVEVMSDATLVEIPSDPTTVDC